MVGFLLSNVEQLVLLAVLKLAPDAYAVTVREELEAQTDRRFSRGTIYVTLERLERKGFVSSELGEPTHRRGGKAKRLFSMTPAGLEMVRRSREILQRLWSEAGHSLEEL